MTVESILWRRLDAPGHDACRLEARDGGWRLHGTAVFRHHGAAAALGYEVTADAAWRTRQGRVHGWIGAVGVDLRVARTRDGAWMLNGNVVPGLDACVDLDLGFTPATNLLPLRRLALRIGQAALVRAAWLDAAAGTLDELPQRYERRRARAYRYEAPRFGYAAALGVDARGFVRRYPGLWRAEAGRGTARR